MITIFKNKKDIPESMEYIELNDLFFNKNTVMKIDEKAKEIINKIDGAQLIGKYKIRSKFDDFTLDIDKLSTGCKTVLNVLYFSNKELFMGDHCLSGIICYSNIILFLGNIINWKEWKIRLFLVSAHRAKKSKIII